MQLLRARAERGTQTLKRGMGAVSVTDTSPGRDGQNPPMPDPARLSSGPVPPCRHKSSHARNDE